MACRLDGIAVKQRLDSTFKRSASVFALIENSCFLNCNAPMSHVDIWRNISAFIIIIHY